ncbi:MAG: Amt family ammonium transporter, partial [Paracoccaceae bacterium]
MIKRLALLSAGAALFAAAPAFAQDTAAVVEVVAVADVGAVPAQSVFIFNTLLFLIGGFLVMWMAAGFAMLEAGL